MRWLILRFHGGSTLSYECLTYTKLYPGGSLGIGLSAVQLLLSLGASVVSADLREPAEGAVSSPQFTFYKANVTKWQELVGLFKKTIELHGQVDHVFSNAGVGPETNYINGIELDDNGDPKEPNSVVLDVISKVQSTQRPSRSTISVRTQVVVVSSSIALPRGSSASAPSIMVNASRPSLYPWRGSVEEGCDPVQLFSEQGKTRS